MNELNQIEEIQKLYAMPKSYLIPKEPKDGETQVKVNIKSLELDEMSLLNFKEGMPMNEVATVVKTMFSRSLGITEEQAGKLSFKYMTDLLDAVMDANNMTDDDIKKTGIKDFLAKKREQIAAQESKPDVKLA